MYNSTIVFLQQIPSCFQSHCIEVVQGDIFMEQKMRFGLVLGTDFRTDDCIGEFIKRK